MHTLSIAYQKATDTQRQRQRPRQRLKQDKNKTETETESPQPSVGLRHLKKIMMEERSRLDRQPQRLARAVAWALEDGEASSATASPSSLRLVGCNW